MTHFGIITPPGSGHLYPMSSLGSELLKRGHSVTLFGIAGYSSIPELVGINVEVIGAELCPLGKTEKSYKEIGQLSGLSALLSFIDEFRSKTEVHLTGIPVSCRKLGIDALLIDQTIIEGSTIAEYLKIPFITICNGLILNTEPTVPPVVTLWEYNISYWAQLRNQIANILLDLVGTYIRSSVNKYRREWSLPVLKLGDYSKTWSSLAIISQQVPSFEFPRQQLPSCLHFTGPLVNPKLMAEIQKEFKFPWSKLNGKPIIYASLGTTHNRHLEVFRSIANACDGLEVQLIISLGNGSEIEELGNLPGDPIVVKMLPQCEILEKATLCITSVGMNTTVDCLRNGVPMIAIPITGEQPGTAARISWTKTGEFLPLSKCKTAQLSDAIKRVLNNDIYRQNALKVKSEIEKYGGAKQAAEIIERALGIGGTP